MFCTPTQTPNKTTTKKKKNPLLVVIPIVIALVVLGLIGVGLSTLVTVVIPNQAFGTIIESGETDRILTYYEERIEDSSPLLERLGGKQFSKWADTVCEQATSFEGTVEEYQTLCGILQQLSKSGNESVAILAQERLTTLEEEESNLFYMESGKADTEAGQYLMAFSDYQMVPDSSAFYQEAQEKSETVVATAQENGVDLVQEVLLSLPPLTTLDNYQVAIDTLNQALDLFDSQTLTDRVAELTAKEAQYRQDIADYQAALSTLDGYVESEELLADVDGLITTLSEETSLTTLRAEIVSRQEALQMPVSIATPFHANSISSVSASSYLTEKFTNSSYYHLPENTMDHNTDTVWCNDTDVEKTGVGAWIQYYFKEETCVGGIKILNGHSKSRDLYYKNSRAKKICVHTETRTGVESETIFTLDDTYMSYNDLTFPVPAETEYIMIEVLEVYPGTTYKDLCITEVEFYF